jgi:hypothetical protein
MISLRALAQALFVGAVILACASVPPVLAAEDDPPVAVDGRDASADGAALQEGERRATRDRDRSRRKIRGPRIAIFESVVVADDTRINGDIICIFCDLEVDGEVRGGLVVVGGDLWLKGDVRRDVVSVLSNNTLEPTARIGGDFNNIIGELDDQGADVEFGYTNIPIGPMLPGMGGPLSVLSTVLFVVRAVTLALFFVMVLVLAALVPERIRTVSDEVPHRYFAAFFAGLAGYIGLWILIPVLVGTVIGLPAVPFVWLVFVILKWLGRAAILHHLGQRVGRQLGREMSLLGAIFLSLVPYLALLIFPLFAGWGGVLAHLLITVAFFVLIDVPALGLILLTRAGGRRSRKSRRAQGDTPLAPAGSPPDEPGAAPRDHRVSYSPGAEPAPDPPEEPQRG